jgi:hypothetical protein
MHTREKLDDEACDNAEYVYVVGARATTSSLYTLSVLINEGLGYSRKPCPH